MKSEKGLTFISTAILVVIIALLTFGVVYFVRLQLNKGKNEDIKTDILLVEARVQKLSSEYILEKKEDILVGTKLTEMEEEQLVKEFLEKELFDPKEKGAKYYVLNQENINEMKLENVELEKDSYYIVDYTSSKVYYTKGYSDDEGEVYYTVEKDTQEQTSKEKVESTQKKEENKQEEKKEEKKK
ncbi:MAG: hypothetical protein HFJ29_09895 [Clostridia bacterium]|nr:hypothetical protein [Clostridia bacterium]